MEIVKPRWSSTSLLLYAGAGIALVATFAFVDAVASGDGGHFAWAVLALGVAGVLAALFERNAWRVPAGLLAVLTIAFFALAVERLERWIGWNPNANGFTFSKFLLLVLVLTAAVFALRRLHFPLLVAIVAAVSWELVIEFFQSSGDNWVASVSIVYGLTLLGVALIVDTGSRPYGFWLHVAAGLAIGGALLWWWHSTNLDWSWMALVALVYIAAGSRWERSSWAALGVLLGFASATHFINEWSRAIGLPPFFSLGSDQSAPVWARPLGYIVLGLVFLAIGLGLELRRERAAR
jgi:hypothetical protein